jgi:hypothetical protein
MNRGNINGNKSMYEEIERKITSSRKMDKKMT